MDARTIATGDIHGCSALNDVLEAIRVRAEDAYERMSEMTVIQEYTRAVLLPQLGECSL